MKVLAFDTTSSSLSVALVENNITLSKNTTTIRGKQSELLIPEIEKILKENKVWYQDLDLISATNGPGSFTGCRIGLTTVRTLKLATNLPLVLLNSCEVIAYKYRKSLQKISVLLDAAMDEFFYAEFISENGKLKEILEPQLTNEENLKAIFPKEEFLLCGSGKNLINSQIFKCEISSEEDIVEADLVGLLALEKFRDNPNLESNLDPIYLRKPRIEKRKK